ncbi:MAG: FHA domain-containing protein [Acidimicrobiales bacterium]
MTSPAATVLLLAAASTSLLSVLKYVLLVILWLFFLLVLRGVLVEVRRGGGDAAPAPEPRSFAARLGSSPRPPVFDPGPPSAPRPPTFDPGPPPAPRQPAFEPSPRPARPPRPSPAPSAAPGPLPRLEPAEAAPAGASGQVTSLRVLEPAGGGRRSFPLGDEVTLGRAPSCGVALTEDSFVSSTHARVWRRAGATWVEDLGSTNGTFVNGSRLSGPSPLNAGDRLQVGRTVLEASR